MNLDLEAALQQENLSHNELNSLFPYIVHAVLDRPDVQPGNKIGSWEVIEDAEGHRGFRMEIPALLADAARLAEVIQVEPHHLLVYLTIGDQEDENVMGGNLDFRPEGAAQIVAEYEAADDIQRLVRQLKSLELARVCLMLNTNLFDYLKEKPTPTIEEIQDAELSDRRALAQVIKNREKQTFPRGSTVT